MLKRFYLFFTVLLLTSLQILLFASAQFFSNLIAKFPDLVEIFADNRSYVIISLYGAAILGSLCSQTFSRKWGLKSTLLIGILLDLLSLLIDHIPFLLDTSPKTALIFNLFAMGSIGLGTGFVLVPLMTYAILHFQRQIGIGLTLVHIFTNLGYLISHYNFGFFLHFGLLNQYELFVMSLFVCFFFFIYRNFEEPPMSKEIQKQRKGSLLWKELHVRMGLFVLAMAAYGILESGIFTWGNYYIAKFYSEYYSTQILTAFWSMMIFGQLIAIYALKFIPARKVIAMFPVLMLVTMLILKDTRFVPTEILLGYSFAGLSCSMFFPFLLTVLEKEIVYVGKTKERFQMVPYMEAGVAYLFASYLLGVGIVSYRTELRRFPNIESIDYSPTAVRNGVIACLGLACILFYLISTSPRRKGD